MSRRDLSRSRAADAERQATDATPAVRSRCLMSARWWTRLADALDTGDPELVSELTRDIVPFLPGAAGSDPARDFRS